MGSLFSADLPLCTDVALDCFASGNDLCVAISATDKPARGPAHCILVLDISGSMESAASLPNADSGEARVVFSRLDLAKHSSKVIIEVLNDADQVTVISFGSNARLELPKTHMTPDGKQRARDVINALRTNGSTNLIDAMEMSLRNALDDTESTNIHIVLLTDGEPDNRESVLGSFRTQIEPLEAARMRGHHHGICLSTFGFGFAMNSALLSEMSTLGHGCFSYIPDASMIGTVFCNFVANALCVTHSVVDIQIELMGAEFIPDNACKSRTDYSGSSTKIAFHCDGLQIGQPKHFLFSKRDSGSFSVRIVAVVNGTSVAISMMNPPPKFPLLTEQRALVTYFEAVSSLDAARVKHMSTQLPPAGNSEFISALLRDIVSSNPQEGQVMMGLSNDDYKQKWGDHYTRSLLSAHRLQQCHNYKDPSVQLYGGSLFKSIVDAADAAFCTMPPPQGRVVPARDQPAHAVRGASSSAAAAPPAVDMSAFMDRYGGCFAPQSPVKLADGSTTAIENLRPGALLWRGSRVDHVIRILYGARVPMVRLPGPAGTESTLVTPWHPVLVNGSWTFPCRIADPCLVHMTCVYNVVLETGHVLFINDRQFITLGHGVDSDDVLAHAFFGTQAVVRAVEMREPVEGVVTVANGFRRDPLTGLVCGFADDAPALRCAAAARDSERLTVTLESC